MLHPSLLITVPPLPHIQPSADRSTRKGRSATQIQPRLNGIQEEAVLALQMRESTRNKRRVQESHLFLVVTLRRRQLLYLRISLAQMTAVLRHHNLNTNRSLSGKSTLKVQAEHQTLASRRSCRS